MNYIQFMAAGTAAKLDATKSYYYFGGKWYSRTGTSAVNDPEVTDPSTIKLASQIVSFDTSALSASGDPYFGDGGMLINPLPGMELDMMYGAFSSSGCTAVPEPTSGLLMLVGFGALALRRGRRA